MALRFLHPTPKAIYRTGRITGSSRVAGVAKLPKIFGTVGSTLVLRRVQRSCPPLGDPYSRRVVLTLHYPYVLKIELFSSYGVDVTSGYLGFRPRSITVDDIDGTTFFEA